MSVRYRSPCSQQGATGYSKDLQVCDSYRTLEYPVIAQKRIVGTRRVLFSALRIGHESYEEAFGEPDIASPTLTLAV